MSAFVQSCTFWSSWLPSTLGLVGTGLLAWSTWRAVHLARDRSSVMSRLLDLEAAKAAATSDPAEERSGSDGRLAALDASEAAFLEARKKDLEAADRQWTPWDTRRTVAGVGLTILSYALPAVAYLPWLCGVSSAG